MKERETVDIYRHMDSPEMLTSFGISFKDEIPIKLDLQNENERNHD